jgi:heptosyltransferase-1
VRNAPFIDEIVDARFVKQREFDSVVDISSVCIRYENLGLPPINRIDLFARRMGIQRLRDPLPFYKVEQDEVLWARKYISDRKSNNKVVVLHTASFEDKRCWPIYKYLQLVDYSKAQGDAIKFLVLDFNHKYANWDKHSNVFECSHTTVREMAALISESDLFIGPDSGPMHLAGALKKKSLVMFGSIPPEARINHYSSHKAIMHPSIGCLGCWYKVCPYQNRCMEDLDMTLVYNEMISKLTA